MKKFVVVAGLTWAALTAQAAETGPFTPLGASTQGMYAKLNSGTVSVTGAIGVGFGNLQGMFGSVQPQLEYFVLDGLSLGGAVRADFGSYSGMGLAPTATLYFYESKPFSLYSNGKFWFNRLFNNQQLAMSNELEFSVGANYHFSPWFGVGPKLVWTISNAGFAMNASFGANFYL